MVNRQQGRRPHPDRLVNVRLYCQPPAEAVGIQRFQGCIGPSHEVTSVRVGAARHPR